jgi:polysaccharide biosynthesis transport protein
MTILGGLGLGVGLAMFREKGDRGFRTGAQVETALQAECLTLIPMLAVNRLNEQLFEQKTIGDNRARKQLISNQDGQRIICPGSGALKLLSEDPFSRFVESIRAIKLAADLRGGKDSSKVIGVTSSLPREGKSTIATALAGLISEVGDRAILLDCDLRNPSLSRTLTPRADVGIIEVISGDLTLKEAIWTDQITGLAFLPAVNKARMPNTDQILAGDAMKRLFEQLRANYDYIIVDLSPLAPVVDVRATTHLLDFYILMIEWGHTKIDVVQHALKEAHVVYDNVLGVVLNKVDMKTIGQYDSYRSEYYHNEDFSQYGYTE